MSSFQWDPEAEEKIEKMALQNMEEPLREAVEAVECPDHHEHPTLVRDGDTLKIGACCQKAADIAAEAAGVGPVTWERS